MAISLSKRVHYERVQNGMDLYMLRTDVTDVVTCKMAFVGGSHATYNKQVLAILAGDMLPGGTGKKSKNTVLETFEGLGARVAVQVTSEHFIVSLSSRKKVFVEAFRLLIEVLSHPSFSQSEYATAFSRVKNTIRTLCEDAGTRSAIALHQSLYKKGHPHWKSSLNDISKQLQQSSRKEVVDFYRNSFSAIGAFVCIVGDIVPHKIVHDIIAILATVPSTRQKELPKLHPEKIAFPEVKDTVVFLQDKFNVDTLLGIPLTITRESSEYVPLWFGISILGASSTSRLFTTLRTKESLTYGAYAKLDGTLSGNPGFIRCRAIFPNDVFLKGRDVLRNTVKEFIDKGVTLKEVRERKIETLGKYKVGLSTTTGLCENIFVTLLNLRPISEVDTFEDRIHALTRAEINDAIRSYIDYTLAVTTAAGAIDARGKPK